MVFVKCFFNENYSVYDNGDLKNDKTGHILARVKNTGNDNKYIRYKLNNRYYMASHVVFKSFNPTININMDLEYLDGDKDNISLNNLKLSTRAETTRNKKQALTSRRNNQLNEHHIYKGGKDKHLFIVSMTSNYNNNKIYKSFSTLEEAIIYRDEILETLY